MLLIKTLNFGEILPVFYTSARYNFAQKMQFIKENTKTNPEPATQCLIERNSDHLGNWSR